MACNVESNVLQYIEELAGQRGALRAGLLLGRDKLGARSAVFLCVPSQDMDGATAVSLSGSKISVDVDKMAAEAEELLRMSVGGVSVIGAFLVAPKPNLQAAQPQLRALAAAIQASSTALSVRASDGAFVLLTAASGSPASIQVLSCPAGSGSNPLKALELQKAALSKSFYLVKARLPLDGSSFHVPSKGSSLKASLQSAVASVSGRLSGARFVLDPTTCAPVDGSTKVKDMLGKRSAGAEGLQLTSLVLPPCCTKAAPAAPTASEELGGKLKLGGAVSACAWVSEHDTWDTLSELVKTDVERTLAARLLHATDAVADTLESQPSASKASAVEGAFLVVQHPEDTATAASLRLPSRALLRCGDASVPVSCYLTPGEDLDVVKEEMQDLLGDNNSIAAARMLESRANVAALVASGSRGTSLNPRAASGDSATSSLVPLAVSALAVALLAVIIAWFFMLPVRAQLAVATGHDPVTSFLSSEGCPVWLDTRSPLHR